MNNYNKEKFIRNGFSENEKINIKEICKKFENFDGNFKEKDNFSKNIEFSLRPKVPVRKNKSGLNPSNKIGETTLIAQNEFSQRKQLERISVLERTKHFESSSQSGKELEKFPNLDNSKSKFNRSKKLMNQEFVSKDTNIKNMNFKNEPLYHVNTPPTKPPRKCMHSEMKKKLENEFTSNDSKKIVNSRSSEMNINIQVSRRKSLSFLEEESDLPKTKVNKSPRLTSTSEILSKINNKTTNRKLKSQISPKPFLNCYKNLSNTANYLCGKVKHSNIFVDLTPTTVSPPKNYGTLKKSHSEEHIYAEIGFLKNENKCAESPKSLHYMCTPIINSKGDGESKDTNHQTVKNMIYESFSLLRPLSLKRNNSQELFTEENQSEASKKDVQDRIIYVKSVKKQPSTSNICLSPKLFEALLIITASGNKLDVIFKCPEKVREHYDYPLLPHICFPDINFLNSFTVYKRAGHKIQNSQINFP